MNKFQISNFGPIKNLDVELGDLTILLGPQASGKTLFLQLAKLIVDKDYIVQNLLKYNYVIDGDSDKVLNYYFGDRLSSMWKNCTMVKVDGEAFEKCSLLNAENADARERFFYIPAQRILSISDGRPKNFMEFDISSPYVLRNFSETLRLFFQHGIGSENVIFPLNQRLNDGMKQSFNDTIFHGGEVVIDEQAGQKKMRMKVGDTSLPFMTWSAGQKEFMPLLMAFYCLTEPMAKSINGNQYEYVVVEEPEMGLHPRAIQSVIIQILELIKMGYKVIVSTHSPVLLEFAWTFKMLQQFPQEVREQALCELFDASLDSNVGKTVKGAVSKDVRTFYFSHTKKGVVTDDISSLDVSSENMGEAEWGGLSQFASKASEVVSKYMAEYGED